MKLDKMPHIIYADIESLIKKRDRCTINPEKPSIIKIRSIFLCEYSISAIWEFDHTENKYTLYHEKYCMKKFCESLREHMKNITGFEKKRMLPLTKKKKKKKKIKIISRCKSMIHL